MSDEKRLKGRAILLGVTGGVAAYKAVDLASRLAQAGALVEVIMTPAATEFVRPLSFASVTRRDVHVDAFASYNAKPGHVSLADWAELAIVAPATANTLAKLAWGLADNLLAATFLASRAPLLLAPAMNDNMWANPATQENLKALKKRGAKTVGPESGALACGRSGLGRMAEPADILKAAASLLGQAEKPHGSRKTGKP